MPKRISNTERQFRAYDKVVARLQSSLETERKLSAHLTHKLRNLSKETNYCVILSGESQRMRQEVRPLLVTANLSVQRVPPDFGGGLRFTASHLSGLGTWENHTLIDHKQLLASVDKDALYRFIAAEFAKGLLSIMENISERPETPNQP